MTTRLTVALLLLTYGIASAQEAGRDVVSGELGTKLDRYMSGIAAYGMSGTILIARGGEVILHKGYGLANRSTRLPASTETEYNIGSLGKQFTAAAIMKLEMQGKLKTTDPLRNFFDDVPADKAEITVHQLLTHSSGLPYFPKDGLFGVAERPDVMREMLALPLESKPGEKYSYSNPGYTLLAGVIERASGMKFEEYVRKEIFTPAGMTAIRFEGEKSSRAPELATHSYTGGHDEGSIDQFPPASSKTVGAGTLISTVADLYKWEKALQKNTVLSDSATRKLFTPYVPTGGPASGPGNARYAYGWNVITTVRNTTLLTHAGDIGGYNADFRRYVDEGLVVIFTSNGRPGAGWRQAVMNNVSLLIAGAPHAAPPTIVDLPAEKLRRWVGSYSLPSGARFHTWMERDRLMLSAEGQEAIALLAGADPRDSGTHAFYSSRALAVVEGLVKGDADPLRENLHGSIPFEGAKAGSLAAWRRYVDSLGSFKRAEAIGTAVSSPTAAQTWVRVTFERGAMTVLYVWAGGKIANFEDWVERPMVTIVAPESETTLAAFDPFSGRTIRAIFTPGTGGSPDGLTIAGKTEGPTARRDPN